MPMWSLPAVGWRGEAHHCLMAMAKRQIFAFATLEILEEVRGLAAAEGNKFQHPPANLLTGITTG